MTTTDAKTLAAQIVDQMSDDDRASFLGSEWSEGLSAMVETADELDELLDAIEELLEEQYATRCADEDRDEEAARYEANQAACDRCLESPAVSGGLCADCLANDETREQEAKKMGLAWLNANRAESGMHPLRAVTPLWWELNRSRWL